MTYRRALVARPARILLFASLVVAAASCSSRPLPPAPGIGGVAGGGTGGGAGTGGVGARGGGGGRGGSPLGQGGFVPGGMGGTFDDCGYPCLPAGTGGGPATGAAGSSPSACPGLPARLPGARSNMGAAAIDARIYLLGGYVLGGVECHAPLTAYDPADNSYRALGSLPTDLYGAPALVPYGNQLLVLDRALWRYATATDVWSPGRPPDQTIIERAGALGPDFRAYFAGGDLYPSGGETNRVDVYDPNADSWTALPPLPFAGKRMGAAISGNRLYVIGLRSAVYDLATHQWTELPPQPTPRMMLGVVAAQSGQILAIGGFWFGIGSSAALDIFDPKTGAWTVGEYMPIPVFGVAVATGCDGRVFAFGGTSPLGIVPAVQVLGTDGHWGLSPGL